ncbi:MAG: alpha/beta hydrolase [Cyclobacteriaceae bacterium]
MRTTILLLFHLIWLNGMTQPMNKSELFTLKNGHKLYYEVYGQGDPLLLLHGYTLSSKSWMEFVNEYSAKYQVILVDLQGHGKSGSFDSDLSIKSVASEVDELIQHLNFKSLFAIGFSFGGDVLFQLASSRPGLVKSFISIGACGFWNSKDFPNWIDWLSYKNIENLKYMYEYQGDENQIKKY